MNRLLRTLAVGLLCLAVLLGCVPRASAAGFRDVPTDAYYYPAVLWATGEGITHGARPDLFNPNGLCTRAHALTFLWRAKGCPEPTTMSTHFTDVEQGRWYTKAVLWAAENGIAAGTSKTTFSPNRNATRAEVVTFIWRTLGKPAYHQTAGFTDVVDGAYYYKAVQWAVEARVVTGTSSKQFSPESPSTRAQTVTFLYRAYDAVPRAQALESALRTAIAAQPGTWSVYLYQPNSNILINLNPQRLPAASLIKLYVAGACEEAIAAGSLPASIEKNVMDPMLIQSSNYCCNYLIDQLTMAGINRFITQRGYPGTSLGRKMGGTGSGENYTMPEACCRVLQEVNSGTYVNAAASAHILQDLLNQERRTKIPAGIPSGIAVGNKTGETSTSQHDAAVVFAPAGTYYLCVMNVNFASSSAAVKAIAALSKTVYDSIGRLPS